MDSINHTFKGNTPNTYINRGGKQESCSASQKNMFSVLLVQLRVLDYLLSVSSKSVCLIRFII